MAYVSILFFFFNDTATTEIYTLSLHDALPICFFSSTGSGGWNCFRQNSRGVSAEGLAGSGTAKARLTDRKSTRLNSSHLVISYAVFCLKKKKKRRRRRAIDVLYARTQRTRGRI